MSSADVGRRPSDARRAALRKASEDMGPQGVPLVSNFFPLDRYYHAAESVLDAFDRAYNERRLDDAYVYGKRFAIFSLNALPTHNYYKSTRYAQQRTKNQHDMTEAILKLEQVAKWMDEEEIVKLRERQRREMELRRREEERMKREAEATKARLMQFQNDSKQHLQHHSAGQPSNVQQSALDKLKMLDGNFGTEEVAELNDSFPRRASLSRESSRRSLTGDGGKRMQRRGSNDSKARSGSPRPRRRYSNEDSATRQSGDSRSPHARRRGSNESIESNRSRPRRRGSNESERSVSDHRRRAERRASGSQPLPMPMPPPSNGGTTTSEPPPPSYTAIMGATKRRESSSSINRPLSALEQAAMHAASSSGTPATQRPQQQQRPSSRSNGHNHYANLELERTKRAERKEGKIPMRAQKQKAAQEEQALRASKRIEIIPVPTHQGRNRHSTNGCAVISPLVVAHHLRSRVAVEESDIVNVIDKECGPLLREIRGKLELGSDALIIPSDVHDHLVDKKILKQESFVGATGGNIMDRKHLAEFLRLLDSGEKNSHQKKRTGAALFFREHVVSIVKVPTGGGTFCFDLIDSLPGCREGGQSMATRTRCRDLSAFEAHVRYYASSKFSDSNCSYIDKNDWDDNMADFDPRVFQAFVWGNP